MLFGVAIWMISPVVPVSVHMLLWAAWLLASSALLGVVGASRVNVPVHALPRTVGVAAAALAAVLLVGAASGGQSVLQPLAHLRSAGAASSAVAATGHALPFERVRDSVQLNAMLLNAQQKGQPVMLDFYADWCVSCKEYDSFTFNDETVKKRLSAVRLVQADVTKNTAEDKALLKRFGLFGPPGIIFFDKRNTSSITHQVIGFQKSSEFHASLDAAAIQ
jgi:thioredoxin:protein disulfide reductase